MFSHHRLLILGASVRAAAESAARASRSEWLVGRRSIDLRTCDLFADDDLRRLATADRIAADDYPRGFVAWADRLPPSRWIYVGGLENFPRVVSAVSRRHRLWGCPPATLRQVRDPWRIVAALREAGLPYAPVCSPQQASARGGRWLCKPRRSSGGLGICRLSDRPPTRTGDFYCQYWIPGLPHAGLYVGNGAACTLLGVTKSWHLQQLPGAAQAIRGKPFAYAGSVGPLRLDSDEWDQWQTLGQHLTARFSLRGAFGIDAIVTPRQEIIPVEVNPRFTASMELLDLVHETPVAEQHIAACLHDECPPTRKYAVDSNKVSGKVVLYAAQDLRMPDAEALLPKQSYGPPCGCRLADLPPADSVIRAGQPVLTILAQGTSPVQVARQLGLSHHDGMWQRVAQKLHSTS